MKRKLLLYLMAFFALVLGTKDVYAKCTYAEKAALNNEVANVKVRAEMGKEAFDDPGSECAGLQDGDVCEPPYRHFANINVLNLSDNFYINVKNGVTKQNQKYDFSQVPEDGILNIEWDDVTQTNTFTITVYASSKTSCADTKLKVIHVSTPRLNDFSNYEICKEVPDFYLCQEYVNYDEDPSYDEFEEKINAEIEKRNEEKKKEEEKGFFEKLWEFVKKYKVAIIVGTAVIIVVVTGTVIIIRKKKEL